MSIPDFCLACTRRLAPLSPTVADRYRLGSRRQRNTRMPVPVVLGALWVIAIPIGLPAAAWAWTT